MIERRRQGLVLLLVNVALLNSVLQLCLPCLCIEFFLIQSCLC